MIEIRRARDAREVEAALELRHRVFVEEQGVTVAAELDGRDPEAIQLVAVGDDGAAIVGTCRVLIDDGLAKFGRLAVDPSARRRGIGAALLAEAEREARAAGAERMGLHAQLTARTLYDRAGFAQRGAVFVDEGIDHIAMYKRLR